MQFPSNRAFSPFWLFFSAVALSAAWLLPNHSFPWLGFHGDAWAAVVLGGVASFILWRCQCNVSWHWLAGAAMATACLPVLQYLTGMTSIGGVAWINSLYLIGFALALITGAAWEKLSPMQCGDYIFLGIFVAAIASVGLQLYQLAAFGPRGPWIVMSPGSRHFANMAQPNQLASLLVLALLGSGWAYVRKRIGGYVASAAAAFLLFGIALTESRTGWLNIGLVVGGIFYWRQLAPSKVFVRVALCLAILFIGYVSLVPTLNIFFYGQEVSPHRSVLGDPRWAAWVLFFKAALARPLFGFGWGQVAHAQFQMLDENTILGGSYLQAHNLFLDLVLWCGIPLGIMLSVALIGWVFSAFLKVRNFEQVLLILFVGTLGVHSMLEYPLQYAYFLLPLGMVMGCLNFSMGFKVAWAANRWANGILLAFSVGALAITIRDYFRVETSYYGLRFELKNIETTIPRRPPDVLVLTQWRDHIQFARMEPRSGVGAEELAWMRNLVTTQPSAYVMYRLAHFLVLNEQPVEAQGWLRKLCQVSPVEQCEAIKSVWADKSLADARVAAVAWPDLSR